MQPYLFPYIGYFQLINAVDKFILYDDVDFIKKGWINRNKILINGIPHLFTIPLNKASQNKLIKEITFVIDENWRSKFIKTIKRSYKKAPFYDKTIQIIEEVIFFKSIYIKDLILKSIVIISEYLDINTKIVESSSIYNNIEKNGQERIIDICLQEDTDVYINPIGGIDIYNKEYFSKNHIQLFFIKSKLDRYKQNSEDFIPWLSIIDVLMNCSKEKIKIMLENYELISGEVL